MFSRYLQLFSIFLIIAVICTVSFTLHSTKRQNPNDKTKNHLEGYANTITQYHYNKKGQLNTVFQSPKILQYSKQQTALIDQPRIIAYGKHGTWHLSADHGKSIDAGKRIRASGHVVIEQFATKTTPYTKITTKTATFFPQVSIAKTKAPVTIQRPGTTITGIGAIADMKKGTVKILQQARGTYAATTH